MITRKFLKIKAPVTVSNQNVISLNSRQITIAHPEGVKIFQIPTLSIINITNTQIWPLKADYRYRISNSPQSITLTTPFNEFSFLITLRNSTFNIGLMLHIIPNTNLLGDANETLEGRLHLDLTYPGLTRQDSVPLEDSSQFLDRLNQLLERNLKGSTATIIQGKLKVTLVISDPLVNVEGRVLNNWFEIFFEGKSFKIYG